MRLERVGTKPVEELMGGKNKKEPGKEAMDRGVNLRGSGKTKSHWV